MPSRSDHICLSPSVFPKLLESPCLYNTAADELYELDEAAFEFVLKCDGTRRLEELDPPAEFLDYCLAEGLLISAPHPLRRSFNVSRAPEPSLRYLELQVTRRCNLRCLHCYQGDPELLDLPTESLLRILEEFERLQGLRLLVSGGEPMLHPDFWRWQEELPRFAFRSVLITNGVLITGENASRLRFHEVQVSLDGLERAHDALRGRDSFVRVLRAIEALREAGIEVSVATMVTALNRDDFPRLEKLLLDLGVREWHVDVPVISGRLSRHRELCLPYDEAASLLRFGWGGGYYTSGGEYACGAHLCAVLPGGEVVKCGFYSDSPVGRVEEGLEVCWRRLRPLRLEDLDCRGCPELFDCRGGCRYRALLHRGHLAPDPVQCLARGIKPKGGEG